MTAERDEAIYAMRRNGETLQRIGEQFHITRERVRQLAIRVERQRELAANHDSLMAELAQAAVAEELELKAISSQLADIAQTLSTIEARMASMKSGLLDLRVEELVLSVRTCNGLLNAGCVTIRDVISRSPAELLRAPNFGKKSLAQVREVLACFGLALDDPGA